jgi:SAM-dependent methyltransferase
MAFTDHFSALAGQYAASRPGYPPELFAWLSSLTQTHDLVWDCATGNGQAARSLADHFTRVVATDGSEEQLKQAAPHPTIEYRVALADNSGLNAKSVDLITVAQAAHWFDLDTFYKEVRRVLKPGGVLALWTYEFFAMGDKAVLECLMNFYNNTVGPYWPKERHLVREGYRTLPFPFDVEITAPAFSLKVSWKLSQILGYLGSWSAVKRFKEANHADPVESLAKELAPLWGDPDQPKAIDFPIYMRVAHL